MRYRSSYDERGQYQVNMVYILSIDFFFTLEMSEIWFSDTISPHPSQQENI